MLRYAGGKNKASRLLHDLAPIRYDEYREPFLGGAGMLWSVPARTRVWGNDLNPIIIRYWEALRDDDGFIDRQVALAEWSKTATDDERRAAYERAKERYDRDDDPFSFWFLNRLSVACNVSKQRADICCMSALFKRDGMNHVHRPKLERMRDSLRRPGLRMTVGDYLPLLQEPGNGVWIFVDPPYPMPKSDNYLYGGHTFTWQDQERLADALRNCEHKWMMTNGDNPRIRRLYSDYRIRHRRYTGTLPHKQRRRQWSEHKMELIITNY